MKKPGDKITWNGKHSRHMCGTVREVKAITNEAYTSYTYVVDIDNSNKQVVLYDQDIEKTE